MPRPRLLGLLIAVFLAGAVEPGPQSASFVSGIDGAAAPYALYVPRSYDPSRKYPLLIALHAEESNHRTELRHVFGRANLPGETDGEAARTLPALPDAGFLVAAPLARGTMGYQGVAEKEVYELLAEMKRRFSVDEDRVYLTGSSMGGGGALWLALTRPDIWAAVVAVCPVAPRGTEALAGNASNMPVSLFQGELDPLVRPESTRKWHRVLLEAGVRAGYVEFPRVRHNAWDSAYRNASIFAWLEKHKRERWPEQVRFTTESYQYARAYWLTIDRLTPGSPASVNVRLGARNEVRIEASGVDAFTLELAGHPSFTPGRPPAVQINGARLPARIARGTLSFYFDGKAWKAGRHAPAAGEKRAGMEGPLREVLGGRQTYVYGTRGGSQDEIGARRTVAETAARWTDTHGRQLLRFPVIADTAPLAGPAVLFGNQETNARIAAARLPMRLNPGAADYGLIFVYPVNGRTALINSGLPWWTGLPGPGSEPRFVPAAIRMLWDLPDFVLFRGDLEHIVVQGRLDRHWALPKDAARALEATGAVVVHQE